MASRPLQTRAINPPIQLASLQPKSNTQAFEENAAIAYLEDDRPPPLRPLLSHETGKAHPKFPTDIQALFALTSRDLDELALYYHQFKPAQQFTKKYPGEMKTWMEIRRNEKDPPEFNLRDVDVRTIFVNYRDLYEKRFRFGMFIGLPKRLFWVPDRYHADLDEPVVTVEKKPGFFGTLFGCGKPRVETLQVVDG